MRYSSAYFALTSCGLLLILVMVLHARISLGEERTAQHERHRLVAELQLTDLCLVTEARYTRHPAMADLHAPFQDHPLALEHFPSGSLLTPPAILTRSHVPRY